MTKSLAKALPVATAVGAAAAMTFLAVPPAIAQDSESETAGEMTKGEERLARILEGRVAGEPVDCIRTLPSEPVTTIDETAFVYGRGRTVYVQRTLDPDDIDRDDIVIVRRFSGSRLCRMDFTTTVDRYQGFFTGGVQFDQFVPYTRVEEDG